MAKKIIENLKDAARDMLAFCLQEKASYANITRVFQEANAEYSKYKDSYWRFFYWRGREEDFKAALYTFKNFKCKIFVLQALQRFFVVGEWKLTSGNTQVLLELVRSLQGYEREKTEDLFEILQPLKDSLLEQINIKLNELKLMGDSSKNETKPELGSEENPLVEDPRELAFHHHPAWFL